MRPENYWPYFEEAPAQAPYRVLPLAQHLFRLALALECLSRAPRTSVHRSPRDGRAKSESKGGDQGCGKVCPPAARAGSCPLALRSKQCSVLSRPGERLRQTFRKNPLCGKAVLLRGSAF